MRYLHQIQKHPEPVEGCFGCKAIGLSLSTGDANSKASMAQSKWDKELDAYKDARSQGIQPAGTSMRKIREAVEISNATGKAYDASAPLS